nr:MAG TPA: hypothetical protein [Caudoviricetes sp.]DAX68189.1 MAG TPA: hypothetical protein [Crassvirales sp.]
MENCYNKKKELVIFGYVKNNTYLCSVKEKKIRNVF